MHPSMSKIANLFLPSCSFFNLEYGSIAGGMDWASAQIMLLFNIQGAICPTPLHQNGTDIASNWSWHYKLPAYVLKSILVDIARM